MLKLAQRSNIRKAKLIDSLDDMDDARWCLRTCHLTSSTLESYLKRNVKDEHEIVGLLDEIGESETGVSLFIGANTAMAVRPPFPIANDEFVGGTETAALRDLMAKPTTVGIVLLRLERYAIGVVQGDRLISTKTESRYMKNRHRAGGSSQRRFERSRERLIRELFDKTCEMSRTIFEPFESTIDYLMFGGERHTLGGFRKRCSYLTRFDDKTLERLLRIDRPNQKTLEKMPEEVSLSRVYLFEHEAE